MSNFENLKIEKGTIADFFDILEVERDGFGKLQANFFEILLSFFLFEPLILKNQEVIGSLFVARLGKVAYLEAGALKKEFRNQGIGSKILQQLVAEFQKNGIETVFALVEEKNTASLSLIKKCKFSIGPKFWLPLFGNICVVFRQIND